MAQVSATPVAAAAGMDDEDFGVRIARLGLPEKPNVIGRTEMEANCPHVNGRCYCNIYTSMLDRPDYPNLDTPEREEPITTNIWRDERRSATPRGNTRATVAAAASGGLTNGKPAPGKKISLGQYASQKKEKANGLLVQGGFNSPTRGEKRPIEHITADAASERKPDRRLDVRGIRPDRNEKRQRTPTPPPPPPPMKELPPPPPPAKEPPPPPPPPAKEPPPPPPPVERPRQVAARPRPPSPPPPSLLPPPPPLPKPKLPPMMSPTLPAVLEEALEKEKETKEGAAKPLPPLSPTLPPVLEEALLTLDESPKIARSGTNGTKREASMDDTITLKPSKAVPQAAEKGVKKTPASATASAAKKGTVSKATASPTKPTPSQHLKVPGEPRKQLSLKKASAEASTGRNKKREVSESPAKRASSPAVAAKSRSGGYDESSEDDTSDTSPKLSKIVKLKFKHLKWRYETLVKLTRNSKGKVAESEKRPASDVAGKSTGKRVREAEERERTPVPKKVKTEKPLSEIKSDKERMASKSITPAKSTDLPPPAKKEKPTAEKTAVRRTENRNGDLPQVKVGRTATPVPLKVTGRMATPVPVVKREGRPDDGRADGRPRKVSTSQPPPQLDPAANAKAEAFTQEHIRYQDFGKRLKHEAEGKIESDRVEKDERYAKLLLLDSILCYIVAFLCEEEANMTRGMKLNMESWRSIMPYLRVVLGRCKDVPSLYGLGKLLEAVILQHLLALDTDRFEKLPLPDATPLTPDTGIALTPNPHASAGAGLQAREHFSYLKNQLIRAIRDTHTAWTEANQYMTVDELRRFKKTWDKRASKLASDRHRIKQAGFYKSEFSLPLHVNSSLLEAVNFGCSFLTEWSSEAGLTLWESKVKLKEPVK